MMMQVESEGEATWAAAPVLTPPLSLEGGLAAELRPANLLQRVLSLFGNVRPGSDLTHFQVCCIRIFSP
jgi:oxysterol-binding protein-related protein 8